MYHVALRKESVDRNFYYADRDADWVRSLSARRAWIEIVSTVVATLATLVSLSARRAWIEITDPINLSDIPPVALRKESVDRNFDAVQIIIVVVRSLSARRAWIEILSRDADGAYLVVALRKESVDRN